jgi:L-malate glycosyltransferase
MKHHKILISVDAMHSGGAEMFAIRLANYLSKFCTVYFMEFDGLASSDKKLKAQLSKEIGYFSPSESIAVKFIYFLNKVTRYKWWRKFGKLANMYRERMLTQFLLKNEIEVIHSHAIFQNIIFSSVKEKYPKLKFIVTLHGHIEFYMQQDPKDAEYLIDILKNTVDGIAYLSEEHLTTFLNRGFERSKIQRVLNGYYPESHHIGQAATQINQGVFTLMLHSRAIAEKGWLQAIGAVKILLNKGRTIQLLLVGDGPLLLELKKTDLPSQIKLLGFKEDVFSYIQSCDVGLLPSYFIGESLPNSIIEYLYFNKPVIATNIGAIPEMLDANGEGMAGVLLDTEKGIPVNENQLAETIDQMMQNKLLYQQKVSLTRLAYEKFTMERCANAYLKMYQFN